MSNTINDYWKEWKKTKSEKSLQDVFYKLKPTLYAEVNKYSASGLPPMALDIQAKKIAISAMETFNPNKGIALNTYVSSKLPGLKRFVDSYQKVGRIPEYMSQPAATISNSMTSLRSNLDREPSIQEIAEDVGWPESKVLKTLPYVRRDLSESGFDGIQTLFDNSWEDRVGETLHMAYKSSTPQEQVAIESFLGLHGKKATSERDAAKKSKLPLSQVKGLKNKLRTTLEGIKWEAE